MPSSLSQKKKSAIFNPFSCAKIVAALRRIFAFACGWYQKNEIVQNKYSFISAYDVDCVFVSPARGFSDHTSVGTL